jgi:polyphenol oxidase
MTSVSPIASVTPPGPFYVRADQFAIDLPTGRAMFTTRRGGSSRGPYESLNLGRLTADQPACVQRNREGLEAEIGTELAFVRQIHGAEVRRLTSESARQARQASPDELTRADGLVTARPGLAPTVLTADCLPIAILGDGVAAMLHGGWRGLEAGIVAAGVERVREINPTGPLSAAIGPGARACCYEVGPEVHAAFAGQPDTVHRGANLDLPAIARHELERAGVTEIHDIGLCTMCSDPSLFFSHRRDNGVTGRQAGIAWLN